MKKLSIIILLLSTHLAWGQEGITARGMSMAGAFQGLARGAEVSRWNPANLALPGAPSFSLNLMEFGMSLGNNSLNVDKYNSFFTKDYWNGEDKEEFVGSFPDDGFRGFSRFQFTPMAVSVKNFAFSVNTFSYSDIRLPKAFFEIPLQGLGTEPVPINDMEGEGILATEITMSTARLFHPDIDFIKHLALGATFKYFYGHAYGKVEDAEGTILSNEDSIAVNGKLQVFYAAPFEDKGKPGDGVGLDLGAAAVVNEKLTLGLSLRNIVGTISFGEVEEKYMDFNYNSSGLDQDEFDHFEDYLDSVLVNTDTTYTPYETKRYAMPRSLNLSATYQLYPWMVVEGDYQQGLNETAGGSTTPRLSLGTEIRKIRFLPLRFGIGLGGVQTTTFAVGFGLDLGHYDLDIAFAGQRGLFNTSKGVNFAFSQRIVF